MPALKTSSILAHQSFSPYDMSHYSRTAKAPMVRIHTPSLDSLYSSHDFPTYDGFDDPQISLSQWMNTTPVYNNVEIYESSQCPPSFTSSPHFDDNVIYEEPMDSSYLSWPYDSSSNYDSSFSSVPEPSTYSNTFSPSVSVISCSPRSESSALSLSPQPNLQEYASAFNFDFTNSLQQQFTPSSSWQTLPVHRSSRSSMTHSPTPSCSSLDAGEVAIKTEPSRDSSPSGAAAVDPQAARRRFPCVIIGCERRFTSQYTLKVHMEAHKPKPRSSFPCTLGCAERFSRQHDRLRHEVAKHGKVCEFLCDDCGRFFSTQKTLGNHKCPVAQAGTRWVHS